MSKRLLFVTSGRADWGKQWPLIKAVREQHECHVYACGGHLAFANGYTIREIERLMADEPWRVWRAHTVLPGQRQQTSALGAAATLNATLDVVKPDACVIHGDRIEALSAALVCTAANVRIFHVEGGEHSGSADGAIRHAVTMLAHLHLCANEAAAHCIRQLGQHPRAIHAIGSPDIDTMLGDTLPPIGAVLERYGIPAVPVGLLIWHPVSSELGTLEAQTRAVTDAVRNSGRHWVVIDPNHDEGGDIIREVYDQELEIPTVTRLPSMRPEYFMRLLGEAGLIMGNSSAGIREAPVFGVSTINIGSRQTNRSDGFRDFAARAIDLTAAIPRYWGRVAHVNHEFGDGHAAERFAAIVDDSFTWNLPLQKTLLV